MMTMNSELTAIHNEVRLQRTLANITRRAASLWADGYKAAETTTTMTARHFTVTTPNGNSYRVCLSDTPTHEVFGDYCLCPAFTKFGECKHHLAVLEMVRDQEQCDAWDALEADNDAYALRSDLNAYGY